MSPVLWTVLVVGGLLTFFLFNVVVIGILTSIGKRTDEAAVPKRHVAYLSVLSMLGLGMIALFREPDRGLPIPAGSYAFPPVVATLLYSSLMSLGRKLRKGKTEQTTRATYVREFVVFFGIGFLVFMGLFAVFYRMAWLQHKARRWQSCAPAVRSSLGGLWGQWPGARDESSTG